MTFGNVEFHLTIGLPFCEAVQVILHDLAILGGFYIHIRVNVKIRQILIEVKGKKRIKQNDTLFS